MTNGFEEQDGGNRWSRGKARLNPTVAAFMRRGLDDGLSGRLYAQGLTLAKLKQMRGDELEGLGLSQQQIADIQRGARADIPFENLARVLWANRSTCCVCRRAGQAIILHHIQPWATSRDHGADNLAVLCLEHHARAHTRGDLEQNLTPRRLLDSKRRWEEAVRHLDAGAILAASRITGHHWLWFNQRRLFDMAKSLQIDISSLPSFFLARSGGFIDKQGRPVRGNDGHPYAAVGGDGTYLVDYLGEVLSNILKSTAVFNISDDLDRGFLGRVVRAGDLVVVQGRHFFRDQTRRHQGPGQAVRVRRQANGVTVEFTIDRWDAISTSSWGAWLTGSQNVASIVRVMDVRHDVSGLQLACSGLAIGLALEGLATRSYVSLTAPARDRRADMDDLRDELSDAGFQD